MDETGIEAARPDVDLAMVMGPAAGATRWIDITPQMLTSLPAVSV
jgi:hypothetical protein